MINILDYITDRVNTEGLATGGFLGLTGTIFFILPLKFQMIFSWEGLIGAILTLSMTGAGALVGAAMTSLYKKVEPKAIKFFSSKIKRFKNGKQKRNNKRAA